MKRSETFFSFSLTVSQRDLKNGSVLGGVNYSRCFASQDHTKAERTNATIYVEVEDAVEARRVLPPARRWSLSFEQQHSLPTVLHQQQAKLAMVGRRCEYRGQQLQTLRR